MTGLQDRVAEVAAVGQAMGTAVWAAPVHATASEIMDSMRAEVATSLEAARAEVWRRTVPGRFTEAHLPDVAEPVASELYEWAASPSGRNLLLLGPVGTGKTHAAIAAARAVFDRGAEVEFQPVVELLDAMRPGGPEGLVHLCSYVDVLVLDDLAAERATDWTAERLYAIVNRRWLEQLPTVVTSNAEPEQLRQHLGDRMYSRLADGAVAVRLSGPDRRAMSERSEDG